MIQGILLGVAFGLLCVVVENNWQQIVELFETQVEEPFEFRQDMPRIRQRPSGYDARV